MTDRDEPEALGFGTIHGILCSAYNGRGIDKSVFASSGLDGVASPVGNGEYRLIYSILLHVRLVTCPSLV
jgi:hypothetical protein